MYRRTAVMHELRGGTLDAIDHQEDPALAIVGVHHLRNSDQPRPSGGYRPRRLGHHQSGCHQHWTLFWQHPQRMILKASSLSTSLRHSGRGLYSSAAHHVHPLYIRKINSARHTKPPNSLARGPRSHDAINSFALNATLVTAVSMMDALARSTSSASPSVKASRTLQSPPCNDRSALYTWQFSSQLTRLLIQLVCTYLVCATIPNSYKVGLFPEHCSMLSCT